MAAEDGAVLVGCRSERAWSGKRAGAVFVRVLLITVTNLKELLRGGVDRSLERAELILERKTEGLPVKGRQQTAGVHGVAGGPLGLLVSTEEVSAVLHDRATERNAVLIARIRLLADTRVRLALGNGVEALVAAELVRAAAELVRACLGDDAEDAAGPAAELRLVLHPLGLELLHGFNLGV